MRTFASRLSGHLKSSISGSAKGCIHTAKSTHVRQQSVDHKPNNADWPVSPLQMAFLSRADWLHACFRALCLEVFRKIMSLQQFCRGLKCRTDVLWAHLALLILYSSHERILCRTYWFSPSSDIQMFLPWKVECGWGMVQPQALSCSTLPVQSGYTTPQLPCLQHRQGSVAAALVTDLPMSTSMVQALSHLFFLRNVFSTTPECDLVLSWQRRLAAAVYSFAAQPVLLTSLKDRCFVNVN